MPAFDKLVSNHGTFLDEKHVKMIAYIGDNILCLTLRNQENSIIPTKNIVS